MRKTLILLLFLLSGFYSQANIGINENDSTLKADDSEVRWRQIDQGIIDGYKVDSDFQYSLKPETSNNFLYGLFAKFLKWLFGNGINLDLSGTIFRILVTLFVIAAIVFVVMQLLKMSSSGLMERTSKQVLGGKIDPDNIHEIDFENSIRDALENHQYRLVTRLYYLYALKILADANKLSWQPWKSNADYQLELKDGTLKPHFYTLGYYFEFIWYGNFEANTATVEEVKSSFQHILNSKQQ